MTDSQSTGVIPSIGIPIQNEVLERESFLEPLFHSISFYALLWIGMFILSLISIFRFDDVAFRYPIFLFLVVIAGYIVWPLIRQVRFYKISSSKGAIETMVWIFFLLLILSFSSIKVQSGNIIGCKEYVGARVITQVFSPKYCDSHRMPFFAKVIYSAFYYGITDSTELYSRTEYAIRFSDLEAEVKLFNQKNEYYITNMECYYYVKNTNNGPFVKSLDFTAPSDVKAVCPEHYPETLKFYDKVTKTKVEALSQDTYLLNSGKFIINKI